VMHAEPPLLEALVGELGELRWAKVRLAIWRGLHCPRYSQILEADLQRSRVQPKAPELMRSHECPLGFADSDEYKAFMSELRCHINIQLFELCGKASARHHEPSLNGFWVILGGSSATFYSEGRFVDVDPVAGSNCETTSLTCLPVYDIKNSDVDISLVLDVPEVSTLVKQMFGSPGRGRYASRQVSHRIVYTVFGLDEFANKWEKKLGRQINVVLPRTRAACRDRWSSVWVQANFCWYHDLGPPLMHQGPQKPTTTRDAPASASSSRSPPLAPTTRDAPTASSFTMITVPSSMPFLVPLDSKGQVTSHYKRNSPPRWQSWGGKHNGMTVLHALPHHLQSFTDTFKEAGEDPMTLFRTFWSNFLESRVFGRIRFDDVEVIYIYIYIYI
jgi:hypothetical protein